MSILLSFYFIFIVVGFNSIRPFGGRARFLLYGRGYSAGLCFFGLGVRTHINLPTRQLGGETDVLPTLADGKTQLIIGYEHARFAMRQNFHALRFRRREGVGKKLSRVLRPLPNLQFLLAALVTDCHNSRAALADTGPPRVPSFGVGSNGNFGAAARLAGNRFNLNDAVADFRNLQGKKFAHKFWVRAG